MHELPSPDKTTESVIALMFFSMRNIKYFKKMKSMSVNERYVDFHPGSDEHVSAGDPGGGDDPALVLPGSYHRQKQAAPQEPGGVWSTVVGSHAN